MPGALSLGLKSGLAAVLLAGSVAACGPSDIDNAPAPESAAARPADSVRIAAFNAYLNRPTAGALIDEAAAGQSAQIMAVAEIIRRVDPDIILISEIDRDGVGQALALFKAYFLASGRNGAPPIDFPYAFFAPVNTGMPSGHDLNRDGEIVRAPGAPGYADDAFGFGAFPGQYGMAVLSKYPIDEARMRTFQKFLWKDMPGALLPDDPATPEPGDWYPAAARGVLRLSSKSHWDLPVRIGESSVHILAGHPTPPAFDGPEARNRRRNHDEIRLWADYIAPETSAYIYDDAGARGGLADGERFVILGDLNADPADGASWPGAIGQILAHPRVNADAVPKSAGGEAAARSQGGVNPVHRGAAAADTADFSDMGGKAPGNLRADYVLPSRAGLRVVDSGVFWPARGEAFFNLVGDGGDVVSSDHRLVWIDVVIVEPK